MDRLPTDGARRRPDLAAEGTPASLFAHFTRPAEVRVSDDVLFREVDCEAVILELGSGRYFGLDEVGQRIWSMLIRRRSLAEIVDALVAEYDAPAERIRADVAEFIDRLSTLELLIVERRAQDRAVR